MLADVQNGKTRHANRRRRREERVNKAYLAAGGGIGQPEENGPYKYHRCETDDEKSLG
jgi:hypothetical protein